MKSCAVEKIFEEEILCTTSTTLQDLGPLQNEAKCVLKLKLIHAYRNRKNTRLFFIVFLLILKVLPELLENNFLFFFNMNLNIFFVGSDILTLIVLNLS